MKLTWFAQPNKVESGLHIFLDLLDILEIGLNTFFKNISPDFGKQDITVFIPFQIA